MKKVEEINQQNLNNRLINVKSVKTLLEKYIENEDLSFFDCANRFFKDEFQGLTKKGKEAKLKTLLQTTIHSLLLEIISLQKESMTKTAFDDKMPEDRKLLLKLRQNLLQQKVNINNNELYKYLRDALDHNTKEAPNFITLETGKFLVKLRKNKNQEPIEIEFSIQDLVDLFVVYNSNITNMDQEVAFYQLNLREALESKSLTIDNVGDFIKIKENSQPIEMDEKQKKALVNYFNSTYNYALKNLGINICDWEVSSYKTPFKRNHVNVVKDKIKAFTYLVYLFENINLNCFELETKFVKELIQKPIHEWIIIDYFSDIIAPIGSNILYTLCANFSIQDLNKILADDLQLTEEEINSLRNSIIHGRYFYNYDKYDGYEIYDGRKEMQHITTLGIGSVENLISKIDEKIENLEL